MFRVVPHGFTSYAYSCNKNDYMEVSINYSGTTTNNTYLDNSYQVSNIGEYSLHKRADGSDGIVCDVVNQGDTLFLEAPQGSFIYALTSHHMVHPQVVAMIYPQHFVIFQVVFQLLRVIV